MKIGQDAIEIKWWEWALVPFTICVAFVVALWNYIKKAIE